MNGFHDSTIHPGYRVGRAAFPYEQQQPASAVPWLERVLVGAWERHKARQRAAERGKGTEARLVLLNPNENSDVKVEKYVFSLIPTIFSHGGDSLIWGEATGWTAFKNPQVSFRVTNLAINVPCPGLVYVETIQAGNIQSQVGACADGYTFAAPHGKDMSLPMLPPRNTMQATGTWSTYVPPAYRPDTRAAGRERRDRLAVLGQKEKTIATLLAHARGARKKEFLADLEEVRDGLTELAQTPPPLRVKYVLALDFTGWATVIA